MFRILALGLLLTGAVAASRATDVQVWLTARDQVSLLEQDRV